MHIIKLLISLLRNQKSTLMARYKVTQIGIFGSYVRGTQQPQSDVDILVDFDEYPSLLEFVGLEDELSQQLGIKVYVYPFKENATH